MTMAKLSTEQDAYNLGGGGRPTKQDNNIRMITVGRLSQFNCVLKSEYNKSPYNATNRVTSVDYINPNKKTIIIHYEYLINGEEPQLVSSTSFRKEVSAKWTLYETSFTPSQDISITLTFKSQINTESTGEEKTVTQIVPIKANNNSGTNTEEVIVQPSQRILALIGYDINAILSEPSYTISDSSIEVKLVGNAGIYTLKKGGGGDLPDLPDLQKYDIYLIPSLTTTQRRGFEETEHYAIDEYCGITSSSPSLATDSNPKSALNLATFKEIPFDLEFTANLSVSLGTKENSFPAYAYTNVPVRYDSLSRNGNATELPITVNNVDAIFYQISDVTYNGVKHNSDFDITIGTTTFHFVIGYSNLYKLKTL